MPLYSCGIRLAPTISLPVIPPSGSLALLLLSTWYSLRCSSISTPDEYESGVNAPANANSSIPVGVDCRVQR